MQESHIIKTLKAQKSSASIATCDYSGDDSHCPPINPEKHQFFIRTGTKMSCANSGASTFLKDQKLSHLNVEIRDIIDKRSTAPSLFNKSRSEKSREKFSGQARVKVALVAWTIVENQKELINLSSRFYKAPEEDTLISRLRDWTWKRQRHISLFKSVTDRDTISIPSHGNIRNVGWWRYPYAGWKQRKRTQDYFKKHYKIRQDGYKLLDEEGLKNPNINVNLSPPQHSPRGLLQQIQPTSLTVLPPLSGQVHTIAYDDEVMANAGDALLRCVNEGTEESPSFLTRTLMLMKKYASVNLSGGR